MSRLLSLVLKPVQITDSTPKTPRETRQRTAPISLFLRPSSPTTYQHNRGKESSAPPIPVKSPRRRLFVGSAEKNNFEVTSFSTKSSLGTAVATTELDTVAEEAEEEELRQIMDEVRRSYIKGNYKNCSSLCTSLLTRPGTKHPIHEIYLTFYLATSLELQSKPLPVAQRLVILHKAKYHYETTSALISTSLGSTRDSFYSVASTAPTTPTSDRSSRAYSPTSSISSVDSWPTSPKALGLPASSQATPINLAHPRISSNAAPKTRPQLSLSIPSSQPRLTGFSSQLGSLAKQLHQYISGIESEIKSLQAPNTLPTFRSICLPGFTSDEMKALERQVRIREFKTRPRTRFDPSRTKKLCDDALEELYS